MTDVNISVPLLHFGTDGVRGIANSELTPELALRLGQAAATQLRELGDGPVIIGRDTRKSCHMLEDALASGLMSVGLDVVRVGAMPTPGVAYLVEVFNGVGGAVVSASHNPAPYNGIKIFGPNGFKLDEKVEAAIEAQLTGTSTDRPTGPAVGISSYAADAQDRYMDHLRHTAPLKLKGMNVALDCANGATTAVAPRVFRLMGADVTVIGNSPDGVNINLDCGSTYPQKLIDLVTEGEFDLGLAFDGDGDRVIAVDENGVEVDGDEIIAICARHLKSKGELDNNTVVTTVMTNLGFDHAMRELDIEVVKTKVGDRYVLEEMRKRGSILGGEQSGHVINLGRATTGDGLVTALQLVRAMKESGETLSQAAKVMRRLPQQLLNVPISKAVKKNGDFMAAAPRLKAAVEKAENSLGESGRVLVRPSGTEPLIRVMVEAESVERATMIAEELAGVAAADLG